MKVSGPHKITYLVGMLAVLLGTPSKSGQATVALPGVSALEPTLPPVGERTLDVMFFNDGASFVFLPGRLSMVRGDTLNVVNHDTVPHQLLLSKVDGDGAEPALAMATGEAATSAHPHGHSLLGPVQPAPLGTPLLKPMERSSHRFESIGAFEVLAFRITGHRFKLERFSATPLVDSLHISIAERFDVVLEGGVGKAGDYLYYNPEADHFAEGMWGIMRVHDKLRSDLLPLYDRPAPPSGPGFPSLAHSGGRPPKADGPGKFAPHENIDATMENGGERLSPLTPGDYLYGAHRQPFMEAGAWGIFRVHDTDEPGLLLLAR